MASKQNIFNVLPQNQGSDSDEDEFNKSKTKKAGGQKDTRRADDKKTVPKQEKEQHARQKEVRKDKGVTSQPHPLDRQSGTGSQAYGSKPKKSGAGRGNWGKQGDEKGAPEEGDEEAEGGEGEEEKPEGKTLQDYYQQVKFVESKPQINEAKAKITSEQLMKELGKSTKLESRKQKEVDDHRVGKKKGKLDVNHHAGIATDFADLLGFRTGFIEKEYRARGEEGAAPPKKTGPRPEGKGEKIDAGKEGENPAPEGGEAVEGGTATTTGEKGGEGKERREGGQRGGYRGGSRGGGYQGGAQGGRKPYEKKEPTKVNLADESAFPKLG